MSLTSEDEQPDPNAMVLLKICRDQVDAISTRALLEAEGIEVFVQGEHHRAMEGALLGAMIELRAMVRFSDLEDARELIEELDYAEHLPAEDNEPDPEKPGWRSKAGGWRGRLVRGCGPGSCSRGSSEAGPGRAEAFPGKTGRHTGRRPHGVQLAGTPRRARCDAHVRENQGAVGGGENSSRSCPTGEVRGGG